MSEGARQRMPDHVVTARGDRISSPYLVAADPAQRDHLVTFALHDPGHTGAQANTHFNTSVYVWDRSAGMGNGVPKRWLQVGFYARFGGAVYFDETQPEGEDWAWIALPDKPTADAPPVYFTQETGVQFPPRAVMPLSELREIVVEWVEIGRRPSSVEWLAVNDYRWELDGAGDIALSPDMT